MPEPTYRWCHLSQGPHRAEAWIPNAYAAVGSMVDLPETSGFWFIETVGEEDTIAGLRDRARKQFLLPRPRITIA